jgi:hypothetical protein
MTKAQILTALRALYKEVVPSAGNPELVETVGDVKKYLFHHLATGLDQDGGPVAHKAFKVFYVWQEGEGSEAAYYEDNTANNSIDKNIIAVNSSTPTALEIYRLYSATTVRDRIKGLLVRAAYDIYNEDVGTTSHAQRLKWALAILGSLEVGVNTMMAFISMNALILSGSFVDEDLRFIVNANITKWAVAIYS